MKKRIHINKHYIASNLKHGTDKPVISVKTYKDNYYGHAVDVMGPSRFVYAEKPLPCGARVWAETESKVILYNRVERTKTVIE